MTQSYSAHPVEVPGETEREYIGDGVYASFDGYNIWLRTLEGMAIALDPRVQLALRDYTARLHAKLGGAYG